MPSFGKPSETPAPTSTGDSDSDFAGMGLGGDNATPLGVFPATCVGIKPIKSERYQGVALEFTLDHNGDEYVIMAPKITDDMDPKARKLAKLAWQRIGNACRAMGVPVAPSQMPVQPSQCENRPCRLAVSTYDKGGIDTPTIVLGRPKLRLRDGVQVGFDPNLADASGKCPDYGCGVLPPAA